MLIHNYNAGTINVIIDSGNAGEFTYFFRVVHSRPGRVVYKNYPEESNLFQLKK